MICRYEIALPALFPTSGLALSIFSIQLKRRRKDLPLARLTSASDDTVLYVANKHDAIYSPIRSLRKLCFAQSTLLLTYANPIRTEQKCLGTTYVPIWRLDTGSGIVHWLSCLEGILRELSMIHVKLSENGPYLSSTSLTPEVLKLRAATLSCS